MSTAVQHDNIFNLMKGLAIISVVVGHCSVASIEGFVNQYHLATFYFVAGYFFKPAYLDALKTFIVKRIKRLYLPFVSYGLMFLLLHNVFCLLRLYPVGDIYSIDNFFRNGLRLFFQLTSFEPFMGAMWFAPSLLIVSIVYVVVRKAWPATKSGGVILCFLIGFICLKMGVKNPYCIWDAMATVAIFHLGCVGRERQWLQRYVGSVVTIVCIILMVVIYLWGGIVRFQASSMSNNNPLLFFVVPLAGVIMVYGVSKWISHTWLDKVISLCGDYSFEIMALHFISFKTVAIVHIWAEGGSIANLADFPVYAENLAWWTPLYVIVGCAVPIMVFKLMTVIKNELRSLW